MCGNELRRGDDRSATVAPASTKDQLMPSTMKARPVELSSRPGRIFWYFGESYQRLKAALSANSRMTMRLGSGPPSISSVAPARARKRPP